MQNVLIISHDDLDGLSCSAIINNYLTNRYENIQVDYIFTNQRELGNLTITKTYKEIYILDLPLTTDNVNKLIELNKDYKITYIDHHPSIYNPNEIISNGLVIHRSDSPISATLLAYQHFNSKVFSENFCYLVNDTDSFSFANLPIAQDETILASTYLNDLIGKDISNVYNKIIDNYFDIYIENNVLYFYNDEVQRDYWLWKLNIEDMYSQVIGNSELYNGFVNFNNIEYKLCNLLKTRLLEVNQQYDVITFTSSSFINLYSSYVSRRSFNCNEFTLPYGRGGHPGASGINIKKNSITKMEIFQKLEEAINKKEH